MVKFLVIRFSSIGDIILTTPVLRIIKQQIPDSEIHYLTKKQFGFILKDNPNVDKLIEFEGNLKAIIQQLELEFYDHIIDLHHNIRTRRIKSALSLPAFTFNKLNIEKWLLVNLKINRLPAKHIVDRYLDTLSVFDVENDEKGLEYYIPEQDHFDLDFLEADKPIVSIVLGATYFTKQIPKSLIVDIINHSNFQFVMLGGKEDVQKSKDIEVKLNRKAINLCGKINLNQSASLIQQSAAVITSDTGLMHIAAAFKKPIISIWGNTVTEFGMGPYLSHSASLIVENKKVKCRPCSKIGFHKCPKKHFDCMLTIDYKMVIDGLQQILD